MCLPVLPKHLGTVSLGLQLQFCKDRGSSSSPSTMSEAEGMYAQDQETQTVLKHPSLFMAIILPPMIPTWSFLIVRHWQQEVFLQLTWNLEDRSGHAVSTAVKHECTRSTTCSAPAGRNAGGKILRVLCMAQPGVPPPRKRRNDRTGWFMTTLIASTSGSRGPV